MQICDANEVLKRSADAFMFRAFIVKGRERRGGSSLSKGVFEGPSVWSYLVVDILSVEGCQRFTMGLVEEWGSNVG